jgi:hypothetical protein
MVRRVITMVLVLIALFAWPNPPRSAEMPRKSSATAEARGPQSYTYDQAVDLGLLRPIQQKLPWCTGQVPGNGSLAEADSRALDPATCQMDPEGAAVFIGDDLPKPIDLP